MNPFDSPEFWSPKTRGPLCFNPPAARTVLPITLMRTKLVLAGKSKAEVKEGMKTAIEKKELPVLEAGAMSYMMSKDAYLTDAGGHNMPILCFTRRSWMVRYGAQTSWTLPTSCRKRSRDRRPYWLHRSKATQSRSMCS
jgi:hypothetical protein